MIIINDHYLGLEILMSWKRENVARMLKFNVVSGLGVR